MSDSGKLKEEFSSKGKFYSSLTKKKISDKEYEHDFIKDYHDLYLKRDVLLLADVFEKFRNNSLKNYGLCPSYVQIYLNAPGLS